MTSTPLKVVSAADMAPNRRRGGDIRVLLGPSTVGSTSGFMGMVTVQPGEAVAEHYHPYSEEFLCVIEGRLIVDLDGEPVMLETDDALMVPLNVRHRLRNTGTSPARAVFHHGPLAPEPPLGHVDTETAAEAAEFAARHA